MEIDKLGESTALRVFCKDDEIDQAAAELCKKAKELEILPCAMTFEQTVDYEETGQYQVILWGT